MFTLVKKSTKKIVSFIFHVFSQSKHSFSQCEHFNQVEPFEKPLFLIVNALHQNAS
jgi:hypothetical protein